MEFSTPYIKAVVVDVVSQHFLLARAYIKSCSTHRPVHRRRREFPLDSASGQRRARVSSLHAAPTSVLDAWPPRPTSWSSPQVVPWLTQAVAWLQPSRALARSLVRSSEVPRIVHEVGSDVGETLHDLATSRQVFQLFGNPGATWRPCTPRDEVFTRSAARWVVRCTSLARPHLVPRRYHLVTPKVGSVNLALLTAYDTLVMAHSCFAPWLHGEYMLSPITW